MPPPKKNTALFQPLKASPKHCQRHQFQAAPHLEVFVSQARHHNESVFSSVQFFSGKKHEKTTYYCCGYQIYWSNKPCPQPITATLLWLVASFTVDVIAVDLASPKAAIDTVKIATWHSSMKLMHWGRKLGSKTNKLKKNPTLLRVLGDAHVPRVRTIREWLRITHNISYTVIICIYIYMVDTHQLDGEPHFAMTLPGTANQSPSLPQPVPVHREP